MGYIRIKDHLCHLRELINDSMNMDGKEVTDCFIGSSRTQVGNGVCSAKLRVDV